MQRTTTSALAAIPRRSARRARRRTRPPPGPPARSRGPRREAGPALSGAGIGRAEQLDVRAPGERLADFDPDRSEAHQRHARARRSCSTAALLGFDCEPANLNKKAAGRLGGRRIYASKAGDDPWTPGRSLLALPLAALALLPRSRAAKADARARRRPDHRRLRGQADRGRRRPDRRRADRRRRHRASQVAVPPGTPTIDTRGMSVLPGLADMHVHLMILGHGDYEHWDKTYRSRFRDRDHAGRGEAAPDERRHVRARPRRAARRHPRGQAPHREAGRSRARGSSSPAPSSSTRRTPTTRRSSAGASTAPPTRARRCRRSSTRASTSIKLIDQDQMTEEEVRAVVETAHKAGKPVVAHAHREDEIRDRPEVRRRLLRAHGPRDRARLSRGHPPGPAQAQPDARLVPDGRGPLPLRVHGRRLSRAAERPALAGGARARHRDGHPRVAAQHHGPAVLPARAPAAADARARSSGSCARPA